MYVIQHCHGGGLIDSLCMYVGMYVRTMAGMVEEEGDGAAAGL